MSVFPPSNERSATPRRRLSIDWGRTRSANSTTPSGWPSSTPRSPLRAGASCAPRPTTDRRGPPRSRSPSSSEQLGRGLADAAFLGPTLAADLRRRAGAPPAVVAETVVLDAKLVAMAVADGSVPSDALVIDGRAAEAALVLVPSGSGHELASVAVGAADATTDLTRAPARIPTGADAVPISGSTHVLDHDDLAAWTALGLATVCADLVGIMSGAVSLATEYAQARSQYGKAIGSFQAVQHLLADAFVLTEGSRSVALHAAWAVDALPPDEALGAASVAKAYCTRAARDRLRDGDPGPRRHRQHLGVPGARVPPARAPVGRRVGRCGREPRRGCSNITGSGRHMDFADSADEAVVPPPPARVAARQQPGPSDVVDVGRVLGGPGPLAPGRCTTPGSSACRGHDDRGPGAAERLRRDPRRRARGRRGTAPSRASATSCRGSSSTAATRSASASCPASSAAASGGARASASPTPAPTSRRCGPAPSATVTTTSSPATRCGRATPTSPTGASSWPAPTPTCRSTRASRRSSSRWTSRASSSDPSR